MKKFTKHLILSSVAIVSTTCVFAQTPKQCNLKATLITPAANTVYNYDDPLSVKFEITNLGPDNIASTDTIFYAMSAANGVLRASGQNIASGATVIADLGTIGNWNNQTGNDQNENFCVLLINQSDVIYVDGNDTTSPTVTYTDNVDTNDKSCNMITVKKEPSPIGISDVKTEKTSLRLYPNPATDKVMFEISIKNTETTTAIVRDITGRQVMQKDFGKVQANTPSPLELNIEVLNAGVYIVEVTAGEKKFIGKVTKQN